MQALIVNIACLPTSDLHLFCQCCCWSRCVLFMISCGHHGLVRYVHNIIIHNNLVFFFSRILTRKRADPLPFFLLSLILSATSPDLAGLVTSGNANSGSCRSPRPPVPPFPRILPSRTNRISSNLRCCVQPNSLSYYKSHITKSFPPPTNNSNKAMNDWLFVRRLHFTPLQLSFGVGESLSVIGSWHSSVGDRGLINQMY